MRSRSPGSGPARSSETNTFTPALCFALVDTAGGYIMLRHVSVGVANVQRALTFYDPVLGALGFKRVMEYLPFAVGYGEGSPEFWVQLPHDQQPATVGNGVHI